MLLPFHMQALGGCLLFWGSCSSGMRVRITTRWQRASPECLWILPLSFSLLPTWEQLDWRLLAAPAQLELFCFPEPLDVKRSCTDLKDFWFYRGYFYRYGLIVCAQINI